jgi:hypothetical protein
MEALEIIRQAIEENSYFKNASDDLKDRFAEYMFLLQLKDKGPEFKLMGLLISKLDEDPFYAKADQETRNKIRDLLWNLLPLLKTDSAGNVIISILDTDILLQILDMGLKPATFLNIFTRENWNKLSSQWKKYDLDTYKLEK